MIGINIGKIKELDNIAPTSAQIFVCRVLILIGNISGIIKKKELISKLRLS
jgi:hypothetical protein